MIDAKIANKDIQNLSDEDANIFAAFRMRFSEYQEHIGGKSPIALRDRAPRALQAG